MSYGSDVMELSCRDNWYPADSNAEDLRIVLICHLQAGIGK